MNNKDIKSRDSKSLNKIWNMYGSGELEKTDYKIHCLCDYESGVNSDGHSGWFFNTENTEGIDAVNTIIFTLRIVLPTHLYENLLRAKEAYGTETEDEVCDEADEYFYEHEREIIDILQDLANV